MPIKHLMGFCMLAMLLPAASSAAARSELADAAMHGDKAVVSRLLTEHADVNATQADGATALHWAVYRSDKELVDMLIRAGANVKAANREGATPLWLASINGDADIIGLVPALAHGDAADVGTQRLGEGEIGVDA